MRRIGWLLVAGWLIAGCTSSEVLVAHSVPLAKATADTPEAELLDVGVLVFDSGVPEGEVDKEVLEELIREGTFVQIRRTEALYMAVVLRETLQKSGNWAPCGSRRKRALRPMSVSRPRSCIPTATSSGYR